MTVGVYVFWGFCVLVQMTAVVCVLKYLFVDITVAVCMVKQLWVCMCVYTEMTGGVCMFK